MTPMTPKDFKEKMAFIASRTIEDGYDQEDRHRAADYLMMQVLEELGYREGCDVFDKMPKWYS